MVPIGKIQNAMLLEVPMDGRVGTLRCPSCGGEAKPDSVRCDWCGSSLATVSCPACFGAMFVGMKHCPWCGTESSREKQAGPAAGLCPRCAVEMLSVKVGKTHLSECGQCGGLWVDNTSFQQICEDREEQEEVLGIAVPTADKTAVNPSRPGRIYLPCPVCATLMNRVNFAGCSGVVIDWCKPHGSWFDSNELRQIVTFIQSGGLKKSREREKERLQEEMRRLRQEELKLAGESIRLSHAPRASLIWQEDHSSLLDFLSAVWKGLAN